MCTWRIHDPLNSKALCARRLVRLRRRFEKSSIRGYVLDIGPTFFLLALVSDHIWFDGFECFRIRDLRDVRPDPYARFAESALKKRHERRPKKPQVSVANIEKLLLSANRLFPLVTIHREQVNPDVCWIGRVLGVERRARFAAGNQSGRHLGRKAKLLSFDRNHPCSLRCGLRSCTSFGWRRPQERLDRFVGYASV